MSITSKFSIKLANIFSNDKKSNASSQVIAASADLEVIQGRARAEPLKLHKTSRFGFPFRPTCMAYDNLQHMLAIGTKYGYVKLYGGESVEYTLFHAGSTGIYFDVFFLSSLYGNIKRLEQKIFLTGLTHFCFKKNVRI